MSFPTAHPPPVKRTWLPMRLSSSAKGVARAHTPAKLPLVRRTPTRFRRSPCESLFQAPEQFQRSPFSRCSDLRRHSHHPPRRLPAGLMHPQVRRVSSMARVADHYVISSRVPLVCVHLTKEAWCHALYIVFFKSSPTLNHLPAECFWHGSRYDTSPGIAIHIAPRVVLSTCSYV